VSTPASEAVDDSARPVHRITITTKHPPAAFPPPHAPPAPTVGRPSSSALTMIRPAWRREVRHADNLNWWRPSPSIASTLFSADRASCAEHQTSGALNCELDQCRASCSRSKFVAPPAVCWIASVYLSDLFFQNRSHVLPCWRIPSGIHPRQQPVPHFSPPVAPAADAACCAQRRSRRRALLRSVVRPQRRNGHRRLQHSPNRRSRCHVRPCPTALVIGGRRRRASSPALAPGFVRGGRRRRRA